MCPHTTTYVLSYYIQVAWLGDMRGSHLDTREGGSGRERGREGEREGGREGRREVWRARERSESRAASRTALFAPILLMCPHTTNAYR